jgi:hypothetical protein
MPLGGGSRSGGSDTRKGSSASTGLRGIVPNSGSRLPAAPIAALSLAVGETFLVMPPKALSADHSTHLKSKYGEREDRLTTLLVIPNTAQAS